MAVGDQNSVFRSESTIHVILTPHLTSDENVKQGLVESDHQKKLCKNCNITEEIMG